MYRQEHSEKLLRIEKSNEHTKENKSDAKVFTFSTFKNNVFTAYKYISSSHHLNLNYLCFLAWVRQWAINFTPSCLSSAISLSTASQSSMVIQKLPHFPSLVRPIMTFYADPLNLVHLNKFHSLSVALIDPTLDLLKEATVGVPGRLVFLTLQDLGVADGQLPACTFALVLHNTLYTLLFLHCYGLWKTHGRIQVISTRFWGSTWCISLF